MWTNHTQSEIYFDILRKNRIKNKDIYQRHQGHAFDIICIKLKVMFLQINTNYTSGSKPKSV